VAIQVLQAFMGTVLFWSLHEQPRLKVWIEDSFQHFWRSIGRLRQKEGMMKPDFFKIALSLTGRHRRKAMPAWRSHPHPIG